MHEVIEAKGRTYMKAFMVFKLCCKIPALVHNLVSLVLSFIYICNFDENEGFYGGLHFFQVMLRIFQIWFLKCIA